MTSPTSGMRARIELCARLGMAAMLVAGAPRIVDAQGLVKGVEQGAREGNKAAGPVGGVLGGAIGGVVGVVTGVAGVLTGGKTAATSRRRQGGNATTTSRARRPPRRPRVRRRPRAPKQPQVLTQNGAPQLTAEQIVANSDANIERIKKELNLTPEQEKNWSGFTSAMHYLGHNGADRLNLRIARAKRDPPDDIIEQMRNEAQFLNRSRAGPAQRRRCRRAAFRQPRRQAKADLHRGNGAAEPRARARLAALLARVLRRAE